MAGSPHAGLFVWHDLMTLDLDSAQAFYEPLFGWSVKPEDMGPLGTYHMIQADGTGVGVGGMIPLASEHGMPSHWVSYVEVADIGAAARRTGELGGTVCVEPTEIPGIGWFAVVQDPQGGYVAPFQNHPATPRERLEQPLPGGPGTFCWHQLLARDTQAAAEFYTGLFGWTQTVQEIPGFGPNHIFMRGAETAGGMMKMPGDAEGQPYWMPYVCVPDIVQAANSTARLGGSVMVPPTPIPDAGTFCVATDPTGALFAHWSA
jgi:predicted enzyme related to lactoylglutathione lyase